MKKFLLIVACAMLLACSFVLVSSAAESASFTFENLGAPIESMGQMHIFGDEAHGTAEHCDGWYASQNKDENGNPLPNNTNFARVELVYTKDNKSYVVTYPTYYILENNSTLTFNFEKLSKHLGVELGVTNIRKIEIPYGTTVIPKGCFAAHFDPTVTDEHPKGHVDVNNTTLTHVYLENTVLTIEDFAFAHCTNLKEVASETLGDHAGESGPVMGNHNHQMLQSIGYRAFHNCPISNFNFNKHLVHLGEGAFEGCRLTIINLSKCVELTEVPAYCFHMAEGYNIDQIIMPVSLKKIGGHAFDGSAARMIFLGLNLEEMGEHALSIANLDTLIIPTSLKTVTTSSFYASNNGYNVYVVPARDGKTGVQQSNLDDVKNLFQVISVTSVKQTNAGNVHKFSLRFWASEEGRAFCDTYLGGHIADANSGITRVEYPYGISHEGQAYSGACAVCSQMTPTGKYITLRPILISKGYSICTFSKRGITVDAFANGYEIYHNALHVYEAVYGDVEIGILFLLDKRYDSTKDLRNDIASMGVYLTDEQLPSITLENHTSIDYIFTYSTGIGYVDESGVARGDMPIIISAYLLHKDAEKANHYIEQNGETVLEDLYGTSYYVQDTDELCIHGKSGDGKYFTVSYTSIFGMIKSNNLD